MPFVGSWFCVPEISHVGSQFHSRPIVQNDNSEDNWKHEETFVKTLSEKWEAIPVGVPIGMQFSLKYISE